MQINEAKRHFARGEEKLDTKDADGNKNTQTHVHDTEVIEGTNITYLQLAIACGYGNDAEHAKKVFEQAKSENEDNLSPNKLVDKIKKDKQSEFDRTPNLNH